MVWLPINETTLHTWPKFLHFFPFFLLVNFDLITFSTLISGFVDQNISDWRGFNCQNFVKIGAVKLTLLMLLLHCVDTTAGCLFVLEYITSQVASSSIQKYICIICLYSLFWNSQPILKKNECFSKLESSDSFSGFGFTIRLFWFYQLSNVWIIFELHASMKVHQYRTMILKPQNEN